MVSRNDLKIMEIYELHGEKRFRVCVKGTNIVVNVNAFDENEALEKTLNILVQTGLDDESLEKLRKIISSNARC